MPPLRLEQLQLRIEHQRSPVADDVSALFAVVRPILEGLLYGLKGDVVAEVGGREHVKLKMLPRLRRRGDGDVGICFEYAVHEAVQRNDPLVIERVQEAMRLCRVPGDDLTSLLFGAEKTGSQQIIETAHDVLTDDSSLLYGARGRPVKLKAHISGIAEAFRRPAARARLPQSVSGIWRADLFLGTLDEQKWVGTTVKIQARDLAPAKGLRIGIHPLKEGESDLPRKDPRSDNLVLCPLLHDGSFMELFYRAWVLMTAFLAADAKLPKEVDLPEGPRRLVARELAERREFPVVGIIDWLKQLEQPELLETTARDTDIEITRGDDVELEAVMAPVPRTVPQSGRRVNEPCRAASFHSSGSRASLSPIDSFHVRRAASSSSTVMCARHWSRIHRWYL